MSFMWILLDMDNKANVLFQMQYFNKLRFSMAIGHEFLLLNLSAFRELKEQNSCTGSFVIINKKVVGSGDCI